MGQELIVPDSFKTFKPPAAFANLNPQEESLAEGIGQSYGVIGYKGKVWSLRYRGERHNMIRPDDGTPTAFIDVIILGQARQKSKSFYGTYVQGQSDGVRPICSSIDGVTPDLDVQTKQCDTCALCPRNVLKPNPETGKKHRECTDYKRLAVLLLPTFTKPLLGDPLLEGVFLRVPPASLNSLAIMGDTMAHQGFHYSTYVTRITFNADKAHPEMVFRPLQGLTDAEAPLIMKLRDEAIVGRITGEDGSKVSAHDVIEVLPPGTNETGLTLVQESVSRSMPASTVTTAQTQPLPAAASAQPAMAAVSTTAPSATAPSATPSAVDTGFGSVAGPSAAVDGNSQLSKPTPASQTIVDTGPAEESDADLDAQIAGLIQTH